MPYGLVWIILQLLKSLLGTMLWRISVRQHRSGMCFPTTSVSFYNYRTAYCRILLKMLLTSILENP
ncbi:hypothetical protein ASPBRDRAFT_235509 [Aspergillus brasiliensis CBS 101740]|uniref:Uncharacterized protein n=1 Tax=Aspergillus brasiliensis (strain CBS 101740 / IMI 381727 / IBT 21946) TaxID=767769 RepID=A0A1L9V061_ASPBC|nr:hypothetical protein ASPBRDRAFT_235509 [Aspergillus brasiliensis CBS 101740]